MARGLSRRGLGTAFALGMLAALAGCAAVAPAPQHIDITLIGFNDLHGHLEPPRLVVRVPGPDGAVAVPARRENSLVRDTASASCCSESSRAVAAALSTSLLQGFLRLAYSSTRRMYSLVVLAA